MPLSVCANYHLLQEASPRRVEQRCSDLYTLHFLYSSLNRHAVFFIVFLLSDLCPLSDIACFPITVRGRHFYLHVSGKKMEAQRSKEFSHELGAESTVLSGSPLSPCRYLSFHLEHTTSMHAISPGKQVLIFNCCLQAADRTRKVRSGGSRVLGRKQNGF